MSLDEPLLLDMLLAASEAITFVAGMDQAQFAPASSTNKLLSEAWR
jgi:hypothetical protein